MTSTVLAGANIYSIIGVLVAGALFFHLLSKEETIIMAVATVAIVYLMAG